MVEEEVGRIKEDINERKWAFPRGFPLVRGLVSPDWLFDNISPLESLEGHDPHC